MTVLIYILIALFALGAIATVSQVGKPRAPITPGLAAFTCIIDVSIIIALIVLGL